MNANQLKPGQRVYWIDPDGERYGKRSGWVTFHGMDEDIAVVAPDREGSPTLCFPDDLEPIAPPVPLSEILAGEPEPWKWSDRFGWRKA